jgi:dCMP deaminase
MSRPNWHTYFLGIAERVAARGDCTRRQVGAVIVDTDHRIVSTGYNGGSPGGPSCLKGECPRGTMTVEELPGYDQGDNSYDLGPGSCIAIHAEQNAVMYADIDRRNGGTLYVTCEPCGGCLRMLSGSGIKMIMWPSDETSVGYRHKIMMKGHFV